MSDPSYKKILTKIPDEEDDYDDNDDSGDNLRGDNSPLSGSPPPYNPDFYDVNALPRINIGERKNAITSMTSSNVQPQPNSSAGRADDRTDGNSSVVVNPMLSQYQEPYEKRELSNNAEIIQGFGPILVVEAIPLQPGRGFNEMERGDVYDYDRSTHFQDDENENLPLRDNEFDYGQHRNNRNGNRNRNKQSTTTTTTTNPDCFCCCCYLSPSDQVALNNCCQICDCCCTENVAKEIGSCCFHVAKELCSSCENCVVGSTECIANIPCEHIIHGLVFFCAEIPCDQCLDCFCGIFLGCLTG